MAVLIVQMLGDLALLGAGVRLLLRAVRGGEQVRAGRRSRPGRQPALTHPTRMR